MSLSFHKFNQTPFSRSRATFREGSRQQDTTKYHRDLPGKMANGIKALFPRVSFRFPSMGLGSWLNLLAATKPYPFPVASGVRDDRFGLFVASVKIIYTAGDGTTDPEEGDCCRWWEANPRAKLPFARALWCVHIKI